MISHGERKHAKLSASGAERWLNCSGSVALSEGIPSKDTVWSKEGTLAHEVLEWVLEGDNGNLLQPAPLGATPEMIEYARQSARFIWGVERKTPRAQLLVETKVALPFINDEMFGTLDVAIVDHFDTLHILDYKYGRSMVSPEENLQLIFYALGVAHTHHWNFKKARLWIIQPRVRGYDGPSFWDIEMTDLYKYVKVFKEGVARVAAEPTTYREGSWCYWCAGKAFCPLKTDGRKSRVKSLFKAAPL